MHGQEWNRCTSSLTLSLNIYQKERGKKNIKPCKFAESSWLEHGIDNNK